MGKLVIGDGQVATVATVIADVADMVIRRAGGVQGVVIRIAVRHTILIAAAARLARLTASRGQGQRG